MSSLIFIDQIDIFPKPVPGIVEQTITHVRPGRVKFQSSYWPAKLYQPNGEIILRPQQTVMVVGREGITLLVVPA